LVRAELCSSMPPIAPAWYSLIWFLAKLRVCRVLLCSRLAHRVRMSRGLIIVCSSSNVFIAQSFCRCVAKWLIAYDPNRFSLRSTTSSKSNYAFFRITCDPRSVSRFFYRSSRVMLGACERPFDRALAYSSPIPYPRMLIVDDAFYNSPKGSGMSFSLSSELSILTSAECCRLLTWSR
jgi:hypothetical protein